MKQGGGCQVTRYRAQGWFLWAVKSRNRILNHLDSFLKQTTGFSQSGGLECGLITSILMNFPNDTDY